MQYIYICGALPFTALNVYQAMMTSVTEKPEIVKKGLNKLIKYIKKL